MSLNSERQKTRQDALKSSRDSNTWKPEDGQNVIRILKFKHKVTKEDAAKGLYNKADIGKTEEEWDFPFSVQYGLLAENRKIPVATTPRSIEMFKEINKTDDEETAKVAQQIRPSNMFAMNIVDINDPDKGVQVYLAKKTVREAIGKWVTDPDFGEAILGVKGRDIKIIYNSKAKSPKEYYTVMLMDKEKSRAMNSKVESKVKDLFDTETNSDFTGRVVDDEDLSLPDGSGGFQARGKEDLEGHKNGKKKVEEAEVEDNEGMFADAE